MRKNSYPSAWQDMLLVKEEIALNSKKLEDPVELQLQQTMVYKNNYLKNTADGKLIKPRTTMWKTSKLFFIYDNLGVIII